MVLRSDSYGVPTGTVGGFPFGASVVDTVSVTNRFGVTKLLRCAVNLAGLGAFTVVVLMPGIGLLQITSMSLATLALSFSTVVARAAGFRSPISPLATPSSEPNSLTPGWSLTRLPTTHTSAFSPTKQRGKRSCLVEVAQVTLYSQRAARRLAEPTTPRSTTVPSPSFKRVRDFCIPIRTIRLRRQRHHRPYRVRREPMVPAEQPDVSWSLQADWGNRLCRRRRRKHWVHLATPSKREPS